MRKWLEKRWVQNVGWALAMVAIFVGVNWYKTRSMVRTGPAPAFTLQNLDGETRTLKSYEGTPTVLFFWNSDTISRVAHAYDGEADVVSVVVDWGTMKKIREHVADHDVDYEVLLGDQKTVEAYDVTAFPTIYVLDSDGNVSSTLVGYTTELGLRSRLFLAD